MVDAARQRRRRVFGVGVARRQRGAGGGGECGGLDGLASGHNDSYLFTENRCLPDMNPDTVAQNTARNNTGLTSRSSGVFQLLIFHASMLMN